MPVTAAAGGIQFSEQIPFLVKHGIWSVSLTHRSSMQPLVTGSSHRSELSVVYARAFLPFNSFGQLGL